MSDGEKTTRWSLDQCEAKCRQGKDRHSCQAPNPAVSLIGCWLCKEASEVQAGASFVWIGRGLMSGMDHGGKVRVASGVETWEGLVQLLAGS